MKTQPKHHHHQRTPPSDGQLLEGLPQFCVRSFVVLLRLVPTVIHLIKQEEVHMVIFTMIMSNTPIHLHLFLLQLFNFCLSTTFLTCYLSVHCQVVVVVDVAGVVVSLALLLLLLLHLTILHKACLEVVVGATLEMVVIIIITTAFSIKQECCEISGVGVS